MSVCVCVCVCVRADTWKDGLLEEPPPHPSSAGLAQRGGPEMSRAARASEQRGFLFPVFFVVVAVFFEKLVIY